MTQRDNWGWLARIGIFIVGHEVAPEAEWWAMAPPGVSVHAARVTARAPWATWREGRGGVELSDDLARGGRQFGAMPLTAATVGHSSSSLIGGEGWDAAVIAALSEILRPDTVATTNGLDSLAAFGALGVRRPYLVFPPWYDDGTVAAGVAYYRTHGLDPAGHLRFDPGRQWRDLPVRELGRAGLPFEQEVEPLYRQVRAGCPAPADGVFIAGTGFRCVAVLDALERDLGRPVLSANQVSLWHCLRLSGVRAGVAGYGRLFDL
ncbi:MAG: hypothetical protein WD270_06555 [Acetobacterales bacterium]